METARLYVCTDGSRASLEAARLAIDLAQRWKSHLRIVYVVEHAELRSSGRAILEHLANTARAHGVAAEHALLEGTPFERILEDARSWKADLIVMGRTGRTGLGSALLGSEAERVLEFSDRPVLIVPAIESAVPLG